ncbi:MAG: aspartyl protease family protein [Candidatus Eisenbacteria bacterium]
MTVLIWATALLVAAVPAARGQVPQGTPPGDEGHRGDLLSELARAAAAFEADSGDATRYEYASLLFEAGLFEEARATVAPLVAVDEPSAEVARLAGRLAYYLGDYGAAERIFAGSLERDPENARALTGLVFTHYQTNSFSRCSELAGKGGDDVRLPHLDLMLAFGDDAPYRMEWRGPTSTEVPFISVDPLPVVEVEIEGRKISAIIDTGGDLFILDTDIAAELGIEPVASMTGMFAGGMQAEIGFAKASSLKLGGVTMRSVPISLLPTKPLSFGELEIGGIIGTSVLRQFLSTIDYPNGRLVLRERTEGASDAFLAESTGHVVEETPFYLQGTHFLLAHGSLNGHGGLLFHVDSGLAGLPAFATTEQTLEYVGIPVPEVAVHEGVIGGGGGGFAVGEFPIASLGLGRLEQPNLVGSFGAQPPGSYRMLGFIVDGLISHNFLRRYAWTLDFDRMRMVFAQ